MAVVRRNIASENAMHSILAKAMAGLMSEWEEALLEKI